MSKESEKTKFSTDGEIKNIFAEIAKLSKQLGIDPKKDELRVIQLYDDDQAIIISIDQDDEPKATIDISNSVYILPKKQGTLDVYADKEKEDEK